MVITLKRGTRLRTSLMGGLEGEEVWIKPGEIVTVKDDMTFDSDQLDEQVLVEVWRHQIPSYQGEYSALHPHTFTILLSSLSLVGEGEGLEGWFCLTEEGQ